MSDVERIARPGWRVVICLVLLTALLGGERPTSGDDALGTTTLAGLAGVYVLVERLPDSIKGLLTVDQLRTDVELRLQLAGVRVLTKEERHQAPGSPDLYLNVTAVSNAQVFAYYVSLELIQGVSLVRDRRIEGAATTWSATGIIGQSRLNERVRQIVQTVRDQVDEFVAAYLSVNPKKP
jgi:hypothetical protein